MIKNKRFSNAINKVSQKDPPIWFMRQAGRYHSHYQDLRKKHSFVELCKQPELAAEVAMGPINDFDYDVQVYERLSFAGGRFTQHDHDGYAVPTGAVHMVPHGMKGPFAKMMLGKRSKGGLELGRHGVEFLPSM